MGFAEEDLGAAGFAEQLERALGARGVLLDLDDIAGVGGEHQEFATGHLLLEGLGELQAVFVGHGDIAKQKSRRKGAGSCKGVGSGVDGFGLVAIGLEDKIKCVGYQTVVIDD